MEESIFSKILKHDVPGEIIYEDATSAVLLTIEPVTPGHCLVIPKQQVDSLWELDDVTYHHLFDVAKDIAGRIEQNYDYKRVGLFVEGFGVPHAHIHVLGYRQPLEPTIVEHVANKRFATPQELAENAAKLRK